MWTVSSILCPCRFCKYRAIFGHSPLTTIFKFILCCKVLRLIEADHFIHTVNDLLLRMSIGGSGYLCWGRGRNLIAPSERSLRTWLDLEPLLMFFICVVTTFLPDWNQPELIPCPPLSGDSCPSDSDWLLTSFCCSSEKEKKKKKKRSVNSLKSTEFIISILKKEKGFIIYFIVGSVE